MLRGTLISLIHYRALNVESTAYSDGKSLTLMSTDTSAIVNTVDIVHQLWSRPLEVVIGLTMLGSQVGVLWPIPVILILGSYFF
jgi:ATP-binding cassette subfamily C (CFTR/MRP) protein 1